LTPEFAWLAAQAKWMVFVDASLELSAGSIVVSPVSEIRGGSQLGHQFTPADVVAMARAVFQASPRAWTAAIGGGSTAFGDRLTPPVVDAVERLATHLAGSLSHWINTGVFSPQIPVTGGAHLTVN
jgi:Ni,Fe-hydrogenase maturation factor